MLRNKRLNVQVLCEVLLLLAVTLGILAYFSHKTLRQEAILNAQQTLEGTVQDIDNILIGVVPDFQMGKSGRWVAKSVLEVE